MSESFASSIPTGLSRSLCQPPGAERSRGVRFVSRAIEFSQLNIHFNLVIGRDSRRRGTEFYRGLRELDQAEAPLELRFSLGTGFSSFRLHSGRP